MHIIDPGHKFALDLYDMGIGVFTELTFMKREGGKYPGNKGHYPGTNLQEVIRACIVRTEYLNRQIPCDENVVGLRCLREFILSLEVRAAMRHGMTHVEAAAILFKFFLEGTIERLPTCKVCGHILLPGLERMHDEHRSRGIHATNG
jgi:hypothetical protein